MNIKSVTQLALKNLMNNKMRSALTMIGIIAGVASVISIVSVMRSMKADIISGFDKMYNTQINVEVFDNSLPPISTDDANIFVEENSNTIRLFSPNISYGNIETKINGYEETPEVFGTNSAYKTISSLELNEGRFITPYECNNKINICVIGSYIKDKYFSNKSVIGENVIFKNSVYTVVGVLNEMDGGQEWSRDNIIVIPYTLINQNSEEITFEYLFCATTKEKTREAEHLINNRFFDRYKDENSYQITAMLDEIEFASSAINTLSLVLIGVAAIALIVGGIGIMNIMLISVNERIKEIGIRMAVGATPKDILWQFLSEAATISCAGGCMGVIIGILLSLTIVKLMSLEIDISIASIIISILTSTLIGILFGYIPAKKASKLLPVDALKN